jgi:hypothetical protein
MTAHEWVLDTQVLVVASSGDHLCLDAATLLRSILENHFVALDYDSEIIAEYSRRVPANSLAARWWTEMNQRGRFVFHSSKLTQRNRRRLERVRFDPSDWKFVGVASRTASRLLVAEESDYWEPSVAQCIQNEMGISLLKVTAALGRAQV